jgi:hypothetical protein
MIAHCLRIVALELGADQAVLQEAADRQTEQAVDAGSGA